MINRKTNHRNGPSEKIEAARVNPDVQDYQGGSQLKTLRKTAALKMAVLGRSEHDGK